MAADQPPFFPERQKLTGVVWGIESLARQSGTDVSGQFTHREFEQTLAAPVRILVIGAVNSGKSSLINALFQTDLAEVCNLPTSPEILFHASEQRAQTIKLPGNDQIVPHGNTGTLDEFLVIDTPGASRLSNEQHKRVISLLSDTDLILAVLPTSDPWSPGVWDLIEKTPPGRLHHLTLVLQHADLREADDIKVMKGHLAILAKKRCGKVLPVFPIALPGPPHSRRGVIELWNRLLTSLGNRSESVELLALWKRKATDALHEIDRSIDGFDSRLSKQTRFLNQAQAHIEEIKAHFTSQLGPAMEELATTLTAEGRLVARSLRKRLAVVPSMFRVFGRDKTASHVGKEFTERLTAVVRLNGSEDAVEIVRACKEHWSDTKENASRDGVALKIDQKSFDQLINTAGSHFVESLDEAISTRIEALNLRNKMVKLLRRRNRALGSFAATSLVCFMLGGITGSLSMPWVPYLCCILGLAFTLGGAYTAWKSRPKIIDSFLAHQAVACSNFTERLREGYESAVHGMFRDYSMTLSPILDDVKTKEAEVRPLQKRWQELYLLLRAID